MAASGYSGSAFGGSDSYGWRSTEVREPGARRKKLAGYLRAANELRHTYFGADGGEDTARELSDGEDHPFPHAAVVRSGKDELMLFPSYARKHVKQAPSAVRTPSQDISEEEYWRRQWESENSRLAIIDVDVRGWVYSPQRGPMTRKHRLMIGLARQLSGIPAPASGPFSESAGLHDAEGASDTGMSRQDEEIIATEAANIVRKGRDEARFASHGAFSERPVAQTPNGPIHGSTSVNDFAGSDRYRESYTSTSSAPDEVSAPYSLRSGQSWPTPAKMSSKELSQANTHLLTRLKPFMATPMVETIVRAFFFNEHASREHITRTDASGHFNFRSALDFIPTHVRVLVGDDLKLSATEEIVVTESSGVSLISDIDDTIKHSAISAGAREIFRNAFIRELGELTIDGVREWYTTLHDMGVKLHYVSNSPWQMYPILTTYFKLANLPKGSFHLKQYSGMLQGIFEPVAERKKASLDKILRDFPERKFILVGDSGEADLEVYTDTALANPGRVLAIFIRDVTTTVKSGYFDPSYSPILEGTPVFRSHARGKSGDNLGMSKRIPRPGDIRDDDADLRAAIAASLQDVEEETRRARLSINRTHFRPNGSLLQVRPESRRACHPGGLLLRPPASPKYHSPPRLKTKI